MSLTPFRPLPRRSEGDAVAKWRMSCAEVRLILSSGIGNCSNPRNAILNGFYEKLSLFLSENSYGFLSVFSILSVFL